ncbi:hypothetical protein [Pseudomonas svalbardensis]|uniref:hypothetical protein n=1 Tax=Pseudomonas svalbardensis TaxID=3042029 RepID=UPI0024B33925|nr:hypothetical protein [Pseudomonas sp. PMCC200367]
MFHADENRLTACTDKIGGWVNYSSKEVTALQELESVNKSRVEDIKHSMDDLLSAITLFCEAGMVKEANILLGALQELKKLVNCIEVCDDGDVLMVH